MDHPEAVSVALYIEAVTQPVEVVVVIAAEEAATAIAVVLGSEVVAAAS